MDSNKTQSNLGKNQIENNSDLDNHQILSELENLIK